MAKLTTDEKCDFLKIPFAIRNPYGMMEMIINNGVVMFGGGVWFCRRTYKKLQYDYLKTY
ncbi:hypothetical protein GCM10008924_31290 [Gracilibacillus halotolerans]